MTASKPEVKRWHPENTAFGYNMKPTPDGDFVLFCHHEADRAADKARIAELEAALGDLLAIVSDSAGVAGYHLNGAVAEWGDFDVVSAASAALAQQGKENADG